MPLFEPCPCCTGPTPAHAIQTWRCSTSGDAFRVQVPWERRHGAAGWSKRVRWNGPDGKPRHGYPAARGAAGVAAFDEDGNLHRIAHGEYEDLDDEGRPSRTVPREALRHVAPVALDPLIKAAPLKPGQRWITVHPHGPGTEGHAILISPAGDGTYRVIAGAGGALTHLRLKNVKEPGAEGDAKPAEKKKRQRGAGADTPEGKASLKALEERKRAAERAFVQRIRERHGGIRDDLDESKLGHLSEGAKKLVVSRHHRKQVREARARVDEIAKQITDAEVAGRVATAELRHAVDDQPDVVEKAREAASLELDLVEQEQAEAKAERTQKATRPTHGETKVGERAAEKIAETIREAPDPAPVIAAVDRMPDASAGDLKEQEAMRSLARAKAALENGDEREAAKAFRRHEIQQVQASTLRAVEQESGAAAAHNALIYSRVLGRIAEEAGGAARMGLTDTEHVPVKGSELAAMMETLNDAAELRKVKKEFKAAVRAVEDGDYDRSRRAFEIDGTAVAAEAELSARQELQRGLTELLVGVADPKRPAHVQAVATGHYDALADVALGLADQRFLDRPTVDALGLRNSAILLRHALEAAGHDAEAMEEALREHHVASLDRITTEALAKANAAVPDLSTVVSDVGSLEGALAHIQAADADLDEAQRAVGSALGRMEFTATMGQAMRERLPEALRVQAPEGDINGTLQWLHSVGLKPSDYRIAADRKSIAIPKAAWGKLTRAEPREEIERRATVRAIKRGDHDEEGWLPAGIKRREASTFTRPPPDAPRFFRTLDTAGDLRANLEDHVGRRVAEGEHPADIMRDMLSPQVLDSVPNRDAFVQHVREVFPLLDAEGKPRKYEEAAPHFEALAEKAVGSGAYHAQDVRPDDEKTREAVFRTLAKHPRGVAAFKPVGTLTPQEQGMLRDHFYERAGIDPKVRIDQQRFAAELAELGPEPSKTAGTMSLFGDSGPSAEWKEWRRDRDALLARHPRAGLDEALKDLGPPPPEGTTARQEHDEKAAALRQAATDAPTAWGRYVLAHGTYEHALAAMQDEVRSGFVKDFADHYGRVTQRPLRVGVTEIRNAERHVAAVATPEQREELIREAQRTYASLRARAGGKFAAEGEGAVVNKFTEFLEQSTIAEQNQGGLFSSMFTPALRHTRGEAAPKTGQRYSVGRRAEEQLASLVGAVGHGFGKSKVDLVKGLSMNGDQVHQQRVVKMLRANGGRLGAWLGTGSGKSLTSIGAFTDAHARGEATHGLYLVPSAVQQQFGSEVLRFTEPGKYRWGTGEGKGHEERVAMLRDPDVHMRVLTHESFRDTALKLMADHHGRTEKEMEADLGKADPATRAEWMRAAFAANNIPRHFVYGDEWHRVTHREGPPSALHLVGSAVSHPTNATHFLAGTATPHKNDANEVYSMASMVDPERYADRHEFMQSFGHNLEHNPNAIRRELDHLTYSAHILPEGVDRHDNDQEVKLTGEHARLVERVGDLYERARKAHASGAVDVEALRELSPKRFAGRPEEEHHKIAAELTKSLGILRESAMRRAVNGAPPEVNQKLRALTEHVERDVKHGEWTDRSGRPQKGKPSIVFTDRLSEAKLVHQALRDRGIRAALYHGGLGTSEREGVRRGFQPPQGADPEHDVIVATSAAEAGINLQRARVVHHYDVPETEKSHTQRSGRAYRQGAQGDVEIHNWHTDSEFERAGRARLARKGALAEVFRSNLPAQDERGIASAYAAAIARRHQAREIA